MSDVCGFYDRSHRPCGKPAVADVTVSHMAGDVRVDDDPPACAEHYEEHTGEPWVGSREDGLLDRYGWHLRGCEAYWSALGDLDGPASQADDPKRECSCGFRRALEDAKVGSTRA